MESNGAVFWLDFVGETCSTCSRFISTDQNKEDKALPILALYHATKQRIKVFISSHRGLYQQTEPANEDLCLPLICINRLKQREARTEKPGEKEREKICTAGIKPTAWWQEPMEFLTLRCFSCGETLVLQEIFVGGSELVVDGAC